MRVTLAMAGAAQGGAEAFYERLVLALHHAGTPVQAIIRRDAGRSARLVEGGVEPVELEFGGPFDFRTRRGFRNSIRDFRPDVVLTFMNRASRLCPRSRSTLPFVHVGRLGGYYDLKYYRGCAHLIGNTRHLVEYLVERRWPADRAHYIPNFAELRSGVPESRERLSTPESAPLIVALGRLHRNKAFDVLLDALAMVPDAFLWLAGTGPLESKLRRQAEDLGIRERVRFVGWAEDPAPYLRAADIVAVPSRHEPLGNVVIEGWAAQKPVIAAQSQGPSQLIRSGENGVLVPVDDPDTFAEALRRVIDDAPLRDALKRGGYQDYRANFTQPVVVRQYLNLFEHIAGKG